MKVPVKIFIFLLIFYILIKAVVRKRFSTNIRKEKFPINFRKISLPSRFKGHNASYKLWGTVHSLDFSADDVVIYSPIGDIKNDVDNLRIGVVCPHRKIIYPLCCKEEEVQVDEFKQEILLNLYYDEISEPCNTGTTPSVSIAGVFNDVQYSQRMIEDRVSNPHGEHAEDVWTVSLRKAMIFDENNNNDVVVDLKISPSMLKIPLLLSGDGAKWISVAESFIAEAKRVVPPQAVCINTTPSLHY